MDRAGVLRVRDAFSRLLGGRAAGEIGWSYVLRTLAAALLTLSACRLLGISQPVWALVSAVVVIMPTESASIASAVLCALANLVGAGAGVALASLGLPELAEIVIGLPLVAGISHLLGVDAAARTASVALLIVVARDPLAVADSSRMRVTQVLLGCAVALAVSAAAAAIEKHSAP